MGAGKRNEERRHNYKRRGPKWKRMRERERKGRRRKVARCEMNCENKLREKNKQQQQKKLPSQVFVILTEVDHKLMQLGIVIYKYVRR